MDINEVTKFDNRNVGHDKLFPVKTPKPDAVPVVLSEEDGEKSKLKQIGSRLGTNPKPTQVARGRGRGIRGKEALREVGGRISQMIYSHMGRAHRLHHAERSCGVGSASSAKLSSSDGQDGLWNPLLDQEDELSQELDEKMRLGEDFKRE